MPRIRVSLPVYLSPVYLSLVVLTVFTVLSPQFSPARCLEDDGEPSSPSITAAELSDAITTYLEALDKAAVAESTSGPLALRLLIFPDAQEYDLLKRLQTELRAGKSPVLAIDSIRGDKDFRKSRARLRKKAGFRLELIHPKDSTEVIRARQVVHLFHAKLTNAFTLKLGKATVDWSLWRNPRGLESVTVRVARHWTLKHGRRQLMTSPLKPKHKRAVLRHEQASIWGAFPDHVLEKKKGLLRIVARDYDQFKGRYTDEHILNLEETSHVLERELSADAGRALPLFFPSKSSELEEFLTWSAKELKKRK